MLQPDCADCRLAAGCFFPDGFRNESLRSEILKRERTPFSGRSVSLCRAGCVIDLNDMVDKAVLFPYGVF